MSEISTALELLRRQRAERALALAHAVANYSAKPKPTKPTMERHTLERTGKRPLTFTGEKIKELSTRSHDATRWTRATIYRTDKGKFVLRLSHYSQWEGEDTSHDVEVFESAASLVDSAEENTPALAAEIAEALDVAEEI